MIDTIEVRRRCRCGVSVADGEQLFGCLECGAPCCAACAIMLESVAYCRYCASMLLGTTASPVGDAIELY